MAINFTKMNSQGNDFIVIDTAQETFLENISDIKKICSRDAVGCDQLLLINTRDSKKVACKIYNTDGTHARQCGNGLRAIMLYLNNKFSISESTIEVCDKYYNAQIIDGNKISVDLGKAAFLGKDNPEDGNLNSWVGDIVDVGNKHFVIPLRDQIVEWPSEDPGDQEDTICASANLDMAIQALDEFRSKYNLTFILNETYDNSLLRIKVKERGAGWTKSCGSGAIAAAAYAIKYKKLDDSPIVVEQEGGVLEVHWDDSGSLKLVGPSEFEYEGTWDG